MFESSLQVSPNVLREGERADLWFSDTTESRSDLCGFCFFLFLLKFKSPVDIFLHISQYNPCPTFKFELDLLWSLNLGAHPRCSGQTRQIAVLFSDAEETDGGKRLIFMAWTSVTLTNGSLKLGKPLAGWGKSEARPSPTDFQEPPFHSTGPCQAMTRRWVRAALHGPPGLRCSVPACWLRAEAQSLMNSPS